MKGADESFNVYKLEVGHGSLKRLCVSFGNGNCRVWEEMWWRRAIPTRLRLVLVMFLLVIRHRCLLWVVPATIGPSEPLSLARHRDHLTTTIARCARNRPPNATCARHYVILWLFTSRHAVAVAPNSPQLAQTFAQMHERMPINSERALELTV